MIARVYRPLLGALLLALTANGVAAALQPLSPDTVLANTSTYDGQSITVTGVAKNVRSHTGRMGTVEAYDVCATQCVHVFDRSGATVTEGSTVTATGIFHAQLQPRGGGDANNPHHGNFPTTDVLFIAPPGSSH